MERRLDPPGGVGGSKWKRRPDFMLVKAPSSGDLVSDVADGDAEVLGELVDGVGMREVGSLRAMRSFLSYVAHAVADGR